ncbi:MAG: diacylglycerol/lipid kinase family protein [Kineosporiaceae bacterium]
MSAGPRGESGGGSHVLVLVSPTAGRGRGETTGGLVVARLRAAGHRVTVVDRPDPVSAAAATGALLDAGPGDRPDALVVVGGDGSLHVAVNALLGTNGRSGADGVAGTAPVALGLVPCGTGNDFATGLGLPGDAGAAVTAVDRCLREGTRWAVDAVHVAADPQGSAAPPWDGERWFAGVLSAGFDAVVSERANGMTWVRGSARYALAVARELPPYRARRYALDLDGETWEIDALLVSIANAPAYGGGMRIAPSADPADGGLEVVVVEPLPKVRFLGLFPRVYRGTHVDLPYVTVRRAKRVRVSIVDDRSPLVAYADGERLAPLPLTCEVRPAAVPLLAAPPAPPTAVVPPPSAPAAGAP